jgi:tRNA pseudouridine13 synthase
MPDVDPATDTPSSSGAALPAFLSRPLPGFVAATLPSPLPLPAVLQAGPPIEFRGDDDGFRVEEVPAYLPSGQGEHLYLHLEKRGLSTPQLLRRLRGAFGLRERDIGIAGQKDARGVTRQWVSVPARVVEPRVGEVEAATGAVLLAHARHGNKLRLGHNRGNRFVCRLDGVDTAAAAAISERATALSALGLPNWFGAQRFGHGDRALREAERFLARPRKAIGRREQFWVSAVQSALYNAWLALRVREGSWRQALDGDLLEKVTGASFECTDPAADTPRVEAGEVSPSGPLYGRAMRCAARDALTRESRSAAELGVDLAGLLAHPAFPTGARRPARVCPAAVQVRAGPTSITVAFDLPSGSYASVFLREIVGPRLVDRFFDPVADAADAPD